MEAMDVQHAARKPQIQRRAWRCKTKSLAWLLLQHIAIAGILDTGMSNTRGGIVDQTVGLIAVGLCQSATRNETPQPKLRMHTHDSKCNF